MFFVQRKIQIYSGWQKGLIQIQIFLVWIKKANMDTNVFGLTKRVRTNTNKNIWPSICKYEYEYLLPTGSIAIHFNLLGSVEIHRDTFQSIGIHWSPLGSICIHWFPSGSIGILWDPLGSIGIYSDPLGYIDIHLDKLGYNGIQ